MRTYLAGDEINIFYDLHASQFMTESSMSYLYSYYTLKTMIPIERVERKMPDMQPKIFLDSGAFSAKSKNIKIDVHEYIDFVKEHKANINVYANLDVIGKGKATWKNQRIMEFAGLSPLPVFHIEEDMSILYHCIENYEYFCLGGMAGEPARSRVIFFDRCFKIICDTPDKTPKCKVHGFGMTDVRLLLRYPWYSVDSTAWITTSRTGGVIIPQRKNGQWRYDVPPYKIFVSGRSPVLYDRRKHLMSMPPAMQKSVLSYIEEKGYILGESRYETRSPKSKLNDGERWVDKVAGEVEIIVHPGITNKHQYRDELNAIYFLDLEKMAKPWPWSWHTNQTSSSGPVVGFGL